MVMLTATLGLTMAASTANAQDPKFDYGKKAEEKSDGVEYKATAQAGLIITTGNSQTTTISAGAKASRKAGFNMFQVEAGGAYARSSALAANDIDGNGVVDPGEIDTLTATTTESWNVKGRYDRFLTEANSVFVTALASGDEPAGKELVLGGQLGYSRSLFKNEKHSLVGEVGYDFSHEDLVVGDAVSIHSARAFTGYTGALSADTSVDTSLELLLNVNSLDTAAGEVGAGEDARVKGTLAITTKLFEDISFRFGFTALYDHAPAPRPPLAIPYATGFVPLADELDTKTEATLIVNFL
jgi:hypothetical protein